MHLRYYRRACHLNGDPADQQWQHLASPGHRTSPCIGCREAQTLLPYRRCLAHSVADRTAASLGTKTHTGPYVLTRYPDLAHDSSSSHFGQHEKVSCRSGITSARTIERTIEAVRRFIRWNTNNALTGTPVRLLDSSICSGIQGDLPHSTTAKLLYLEDGKTWSSEAVDYSLALVTTQMRCKRQAQQVRREQHLRTSFGGIELPVESRLTNR